MKSIFTLIFVSVFDYAIAQVNIVPLVGINSTKMYQSYGFQKGGSYALVGLEVELRKKPKTHQSVYGTLVTGVSYLKNGYYNSDNFSFGSFIYVASITDRQMEYLQIPVVVKLNWQPFPLVEEWKLFFGVGVSNNLLMSAHMAEKHTLITTSNDILSPPVTEQAEDERDVTDLGKKQSMFTRFELGMVYKRFQLSFRFSKSITDLYYTGFENNWNVPADDSAYLKAKADKGRIDEKYSEIVAGFRIFK